MFDDPESAEPDDIPPSEGGVQAKAHRQTVIYLFTLAGFAYAGKRNVALRHDVTLWPESGTGRLPDGYSGSGNSRFEDLTGWSDIKREYGVENAEWWIVEVLINADEETVEAAERDAIAGTRAVYGDRCVNHAKGGGGMSPEGARRMAENSVWKANIVAMLAERNADPEFRANRAAHLAQLHADPAYQAKIAAILAKRNASPEHLAQLAERNADPAFRERNAAASRVGTRASAPITAPQNIVTVLKADPTGSEINGRKIFGHCRTGMAIGEIRASCEAAGLSGPRYASGKTDKLASSGLRQLARAGVIRIDTPADFEADQQAMMPMAAE